MTAEARLAAKLGWPVGVGGGGSAGAEAAARAMLRAGAGGLVSLGLAAGLDLALRPGAIVIPATVLDRGTRFHADPALAQRLGGADGRTILGLDQVVVTTTEKLRLWHETGAVAADMESGAVARVAWQEGVPFAALRVICDPADRTLPPAALIALDGQGTIGLGRVIASVLRRPGQIPALLRLAADAATARRALRARIA